MNLSRPRRVQKGDLSRFSSMKRPASGAIMSLPGKWAMSAFGPIRTWKRSFTNRKNSDFAFSPVGEVYNLPELFYFIGGIYDRDPKVVAFATELHSDRVAGHDCHHRGADRAPVAGGAESPRSGQSHQLRQQLQAD